MTKESKTQIEYRKTSDLIPYARNSRTHSDEQVNQIASSIQEFGFTNPILIDSKDSIIAGHGRIMAATKLKIDEVPCIVLSHLTEAQKKAYVIADNKLALNAGWDDELLALELEELKELDFDLALTGFSEGELSGLLGIDIGGATNEFGDSESEVVDSAYKEQHGVIVICSDEQEQESVFNRLSGLGMNCKVVST